MADFFSERFNKNVRITNHALESMLRRNVDMATLLQVIENGAIKRSDEVNMWVFMHIQERDDNLVCAAVVKQAAVVIKTVMINWELEGKT